MAAPDGTKTKRERLQGALERALRKGNQQHRVAELEAELAAPPFPKALNYVWRAYLRMRRRAPSGFAGPNPISWRDIDAFCRRSGLGLAPWEIELIEAIDDIYLKPARQVVPAKGQTVKAVASASDGAGVRALMGSIGVRKTVNRKKGG